MSIKIKDPKDPNKEIEVFTKEELEAAKKEATDTATTAASKIADEKAQAMIDAYKASNPDQTKIVEELKNKLSEATTKLEQAEAGSDDGSGNRDKQIERLRMERDAAEKKLTDEITSLKSTIDNMSKGNMDSAKKSLLDKYAGADENTRKKVELEFDRYRSTETTPEAMDERMQQAAKLAGVGAPPAPSAMDSVGGGAGSRGDGSYGGKATTVTTNAKNIGKALGISEEELNKQAEKNAQAAAQSNNQ